jgi:hypothetical protein
VFSLTHTHTLFALEIMKKFHLSLSFALFY